VAKLLAANAPPAAVVGRYGGDEFVVVLPHATLVEAVAFGERVLLQLSKLQLPGDLKASASIGVAAWRGADESVEALLEQADAAAYESKRRGGNRVSAAEAPSVPALVAQVPGDSYAAK
jgi:diguanylate cyclase (GGDEF)-like protein